MLSPRLESERVTLVTIWKEGAASLQFWRGALERNAPGQLERIERLAPVRIGQGNTTRGLQRRTAGGSDRSLQRSSQLRGAPVWPARWTRTNS